MASFICMWNEAERDSSSFFFFGPLEKIFFMFQHQCWSLLFCVKVNKSFTLTKVYFSILRIWKKKSHELYFLLLSINSPFSLCGRSHLLLRPAVTAKGWTRSRLHQSKLHIDNAVFMEITTVTFLPTTGTESSLSPAVSWAVTTMWPLLKLVTEQRSCEVMQSFVLPEEVTPYTV